MLLHVCCGPCLSGVFPVLQNEEINVTAYFFNPNIQPQEELGKRIGALVAYAGARKINTIINEEFNSDAFEKEVDCGDDRCANCYRMRLNETARYAKANGFNTISTTLLLSPYQKHEKIREIGEVAARDYGIIFHYRDFRPYYKDSVLNSKSMGLYRQKYCGCGKSKTSKRS